MSLRLLLLSICLCCTKGDGVTGGSVTYGGVNGDGSYRFGYKNLDVGSSYHLTQSDYKGEVNGRFGSRDPATNTIKETVYTAGKRGFRARGPNIHRKMSLSQVAQEPVGRYVDPHYDDPSYSYSYSAISSAKHETADSNGDVKGHYWYIDDVGERHDVNYIAGKNTGFQVKSPHPDNGPIAQSYYNRPLVRGSKYDKGRSSVQKGADGSYRFIAAGPDHRRSETSDANGNVRGSYSYLDDKGVQRTVHYIAGPGIGYRVIESSKVPYVPAYFPLLPLPGEFDVPINDALGGGVQDRHDDVPQIPSVSSLPTLRRPAKKFYEDLPPMQSRVRAHVQNIDAYPYGARNVDPARAMHEHEYGV